MNYQTASFKDFENIPNLRPYECAAEFNNYITDWQSRGHWNYRQEAASAAGPEVSLVMPDGNLRNFISLVSNDYLGFSQHPAVKAAAIASIEKFGVGSGASPAIGGHYTYHREIEEKIAAFFKRENALIFTTGYTSNTATFQCLLKQQDLAIVDMGVHASVYEGCQLTTLKTFPHNNMEMLERKLKETKGNYRTTMIIIDGVYSQQADLANLSEVIKLAKHYGAMLAMDDAHGVGVIGKTGRGVIELYDSFKDVDIITGTFSKTFAHLGGYVVADAELIQYLKFQARQHIFSVAATPASACILKSIDLIDQEPQWIEKLWRNIRYFKDGLTGIGLNTGNTQSAIIPVLTGDPTRNAEVCRLLMNSGIYANQIGYPAVPKKSARIRMSIMATHSKSQLDLALNAWEWINKKMKISETEINQNGYPEKKK